jgi:hypothetical protein
MKVLDELTDTQIASRSLQIAEGIILMEHGCVSVRQPRARHLIKNDPGIQKLRRTRDRLDLKAIALSGFAEWEDAGLVRHPVDLPPLQSGCGRWGLSYDRCVLTCGHLGPCRDSAGNTTLTLTRAILAAV